jgi:hypothetical protein
MLSNEYIMKKVYVNMLLIPLQPACMSHSVTSGKKLYFSKCILRGTVTCNIYCISFTKPYLVIFETKWKKYFHNVHFTDLILLKNIIQNMRQCMRKGSLWHNVIIHRKRHELYATSVFLLTLRSAYFSFSFLLVLTVTIWGKNDEFLLMLIGYVFKLITRILSIWM